VTEHREDRVPLPKDFILQISQWAASTAKRRGPKKNPKVVPPQARHRFDDDVRQTA
jgi:hypothetical protein